MFRNSFYVQSSVGKFEYNSGQNGWCLFNTGNKTLSIKISTILAAIVFTCFNNLYMYVRKLHC